MDLKYINNIFQNTILKRNAEFSTIGYLYMKDIPEMLVFIRDEKYFMDLYGTSNVTAVITTSRYAQEILNKTGCGVLVTDEPEKVFYLAHNYLYRETSFYKKENYDTVIGEGSNISSQAVIAEKNVVIGRNVVIEPGAVIMEGVRIGDNCVIGANTTIGTRGLQYYRKGDEVFYIEHVGGVIIKNNVEILSNSSVGSGLITPTYLCDDVKVDSLVHIAHSAYIDKRVFITAGAVIGGSAYIGQRVWIGLNAVICSLVNVGEDAFVCMGSVVAKNVNSGQTVSGNFAMDHKKQMEYEIVKRRLLRN